ncbi:MAG: hypothetical protein JNL82_25515 [Myxococcales bacterium]|nr:hypothetical protein [Myxococcales bacterium]
MERSAGATVCDRLELLREEPSSVGVQVFGPTWVVLDSTSGELARACLLDDELLPTQALRDAFVAAAADLAGVRDAALVPQLFAGADGDGGAVLYEPVSGGVAFGELYDGTGSYDLATEVGRLARQLARALAALHQRGLVHGMLTTASVFVGPRGPAVYQYGLAPLCDRAVLMRRARAFDLAGVAPEIHAGGPFTPAADLYAWAVAVAQFASGARGAAAVSAAQSSQDLPGVSPGLRLALIACLSEEPGARPLDAADLLRRLDSSGLGDASGLLPMPPVEPVEPAPAARPEPIVEFEPIVAPVSVPPRPPTIPPPRTPVSKDRPPTIPPTAGMTLPVTSFEEMLLTGDRQRRPPPPPSATPAAPPPRTELGPEDLLHESGAWTKSGQPTGKSASNLRRVHLLTDPVRRDSTGPEGLAPLGEGDGKSATPAEPPSSEVIIGGTREELEAASRATTVKLDPATAAAAIKAAEQAHADAEPPVAAAVTSVGEAEEPGRITVPDVPTNTGPGESTRRRTAAAADRRTEPQDWGKIPTMKHSAVPAAPDASPVPMPTAALADRRPPLPLIFAAAGLILLIILIFSF